MAGSKENFSGVNLRTGIAKNNRRALSTVNGNIISASPSMNAVHKRGVLKEKNSAHVGDPVVPVHRPITRRFAAQSAVEAKHVYVEVVKPAFEPISVTHESEDCIIIDADEGGGKRVGNHDAPMFVQHKEAMLEEIDKMDVEVQMEDIDGADETVVDIDKVEKRDPLEVSEYIDDIYEYYKRTERASCVPPNYMLRQPDINEKMRAILIDWLISVHYKFELMDETLYLAVNLIDRFLAVKSILRKKLQLVGVTALLLACKYEEVLVPIVDDFIFITDKAYCRKEVLAMEKLMINTLQFNLSVPTPYSFTRLVLKAAQSDKTLELLSFFLVELCLVKYEMVRFPPSLLAAAAVFTAQCTLGGNREKWSETCVRYTSYSQDQLMECARLMVTLHKKAGKEEKLMGVHDKYSCSKYGFAAKTEPAMFLGARI